MEQGAPTADTRGPKVDHRVERENVDACMEELGHGENSRDCSSLAACMDVGHRTHATPCADRAPLACCAPRGWARALGRPCGGGVGGGCASRGCWASRGRLGLAPLLSELGMVSWLRFLLGFEVVSANRSGSKNCYVISVVGASAHSRENCL